MHPNYLSNKPGNCPICGMTLVPVEKGAPSDSAQAILRDQLAHAVKVDPVTIQNIGVHTEKVTRHTVAREIRASATVQQDERRIFAIAARVMGYAEKLHANYTGQRVRAGEPLLDLYSPDLVSAQAEYLRALRGSADAAEAQTLARNARQRLLNWGIPEKEIDEIEKRGEPKHALTIVSPANGIVTEKMVVEGQSVEPGMQLYQIVDYSRVWITGTLYQQDEPFARVGQTVQIELDAVQGKTFSAKLTYVAPALEPESRTLQIRTEYPNTADLALKPGMIGTIRLEAPGIRNALAVPEQAIIHSGTRHLVIVAKGQGYFEPREISAGETAGGYVEVLAGLAEGEEIVVSSQFLIDSESNLKAAVAALSSGSAESVAAAADSSRQQAQFAGSNAGPTGSITPASPAGTQSKPDPPKLHKVYVCPMDPDVVSDHPGNCPKCGMKLVEKK
jgi:multidrug efflux pump subunit AcrA (membrane-fusion protein)